MSRARDWCFTCFPENPTSFIDNPPALTENIRYLVFQLEQCPTTKRLHLQGFIQFPAPLSLKGALTRVHDLFGCTAHVEKRKGTPTEARLYCRKEATRVPGSLPVELGDFSEGQGHRSDLAEVAQMAVEQVPLEEIAETAPATWIRYHRGIESLRTIVGKSKVPKRSTFAMVYIWGPSGCGKTSLVRDRWPDAYWLTETDRGWMDSYAGQDIIVIDDFEARLPIQWMLRLCQPYPFEAERKGMFPVTVLATKVVITANFPPEEMYLGEKNQAAWLSRLKPNRGGHVLEFDMGMELPF